MTDARPQTAAPADTGDGASRFHRTLGLLPATAVNMTQMCGIGPFITIPLIVAAMGGPQAVLGWIAGAILAIGGVAVICSRLLDFGGLLAFWGGVAIVFGAAGAAFPAPFAGQALDQLELLSCDLASS